MGIWKRENNLGNTEFVVQAGQGPCRERGVEAQGCGRFGLERLFDSVTAILEEEGQALSLSTGSRQGRNAHEAKEQRNYGPTARKG
jgi:hypothetical protein